METAPQETYYDLKEIAEILRYKSVRSVRRMIKPQKMNDGSMRPPILKAINISNGTGRNIWRVAKSELERHLAECAR